MPNTAQDALLAELPATGEMSYPDFQAKCNAAGKSRLLEQHFHDMRKAKIIKVYTKEVDGQPVAFVSR